MWALNSLRRRINCLTEAPHSNCHEYSQLDLFNSATALFLPPLSVTVLHLWVKNILSTFISWRLQISQLNNCLFSFVRFLPTLLFLIFPLFTSYHIYWIYLGNSIGEKCPIIPSNFIAFAIQILYNFAVETNGRFLLFFYWAFMLSRLY